MNEKYYLEFAIFILIKCFQKSIFIKLYGLKKPEGYFHEVISAISLIRNGLYKSSHSNRLLIYRYKNDVKKRRLFFTLR